jgi:hypothetical protein
MPDVSEKLSAVPEPLTADAAGCEAPVAPESDQSILRDIETASETLALYTAILGKRPEIIDPGQIPPDDALASLSSFQLNPHWPNVNRQAISIWFRRMSSQARRRIDEAMMRLAG